MTNTLPLPRLADSWLLSLKVDGAAAGTVRAYRAGLTSLVATLEGRPLVTAQREDVRYWLARMQDDGLARETVRQRLKIAKAFYGWLREEGELQGALPTDNIKGPPPGDTITETITETESRALLAACSGNTFYDRRDLAIISIFLDCGIRREELSALLVDDVIIALNKEGVRGHVTVAGKASRRGGKRRRVAPLGENTCRAVDRYLRARDRHPYAHLPSLWLTRYGSLTYDGIRHIMEHRGREAGVKLRAHMLRHTWASEFRRAGGTEGDLMTLGGWSDRDMLDRYGKHAAEDRAQDVGRRLSLGDRLKTRGKNHER